MPLTGPLAKVAGIVNKATKKVMQPLTIYPDPATGQVFTPGTGYAGTAPASIAGRGIITAYSDQLVSGGAARAEDRQVIVILGSIAAADLADITDARGNVKPGVSVVQDGERVTPTRWEKDPAAATVIGHTARTATRQRFAAVEG